MVKVFALFADEQIKWAIYNHVYLINAHIAGREV